jgi:hypothetical protein
MLEGFEYGRPHDPRKTPVFETRWCVYGDSIEKLPTVIVDGRWSDPAVAFEAGRGVHPTQPTGPWGVYALDFTDTYTLGQISSLQAQYKNLTTTIESARAHLYVSGRFVNSSGLFDNLPQVQAQLQSWIDECNVKIRTVQTQLSAAPPQLSAAPPAHVDPGQRGAMTDLAKIEPLTCGGERDMQTMLSLLQANGVYFEKSDHVAPTTQSVQPVRDVARAMSSFYNTRLGYMRAGYVAERCAELLAVCGDSLEPPEPPGPVAPGHVSQRKQLQRLRQALLGQEPAKVRLVTWVKRDIHFTHVMRQLTGAAGKDWAKLQYEELKRMKDNPLAQKLLAFLEAMHLYCERYFHTHEFSREFLPREKEQMAALVRKLDRELG